ncbi:MAG TPA: formylglycine-generating enzyme family protein [Candidatus Dormibacteraeota bacterium]
MRFIEPGSFLMGSARHYPEEAPVHRVEVDGFWIDVHPVTNAEFAAFVAATGYVTLAERPPDAADYPDALQELLVPGSAVFIPPPGPVDLRVVTWWAYVPGASWRHPPGPHSDLDGRDNHPVVQVAYEDAQAYAVWAGKQLPTEAQWEFAARGGLEGAAYAWGNEPAPGGRPMANTWQGEFPWQNLGLDGYEGTSPVGEFPANGYGLHDMTGNVWEWTSDDFRAQGALAPQAPCCAPVASAPPRSQRVKVLKGGSHLCAPNYCLRYRPAARYPEPADTSTSHIGFRCVVDQRG